MNIAIIGSGNIGTDLLLKVLRTDGMHCKLFAGRRKDSPGLAIASKHGITVSTDGINGVLKILNTLDVVFDCTGADAHRSHWESLKKSHVKVIDLTPSNIGIPIIPSVNLQDVHCAQNLSLVTCGGQGAIPIAYALKQAIPDLDYFEVVNTIASKSAGPATRDNLDDYITTTESVLKRLTGVKDAKAILILNPAEPCINMKSTVFATSRNAFSEQDKEKVTRSVNDLAASVSQYVPGYRITMQPVYDGKNLMVSIEVLGIGDYLPRYAGNLDIITAAAIAVAQSTTQVVKRAANA